MYQKEYPPIQIGKKAPNIVFTTSDNKKLDLYSFTKKYKVLFFWSCTAAYHAEEMVKVVDHFKGKNIDFINSSWSPYEGEKKGNPWTHFYNIPADKERMIYQVGSLMKMFIIDESNDIVSIVDGYEEAKDLIEAIEKVISEAIRVFDARFSLNDRSEEKLILFIPLSLTIKIFSAESFSTTTASSVLAISACTFLTGFILTSFCLSTGICIIFS
ncbi:MAG: hypothetical protein HGB26_08790, partial [Desulfobulbaceae bacterium]|nr:hypothetical protein [Desulfobulbaceae bacterium]